MRWKSKKMTSKGLKMDIKKVLSKVDPISYL